MKKEQIWALALGTVVLTVSACTANRPVIYPNDKVAQTGSAQVAADIDDCVIRAEEFHSGNRSGEVAKDAAGRAVVSATVGAAAGAAGGAVQGDPGRFAASGAAGGAAAGLMSGIIDGLRKREPNPVYRNFVIRCLGEKGYEVIGWE